jgi:hypothetical protein
MTTEDTIRPVKVSEAYQATILNIQSYQQLCNEATDWTSSQQKETGSVDVISRLRDVSKFSETT